MSAMPMVLMNPNMKREQGKNIQFDNIKAAKRVADVIRTCLGPEARMKMLMDPTGGIVMTNDGNAILREITVEHPGAKQLIEIARTQDEEVGDGTTSVVVLAGELMSRTTQCLEQKIHATRVIAAFREALEDSLKFARANLCVEIDVENRTELCNIIRSCLATKFANQWADLTSNIAMEAVLRVRRQDPTHLSGWTIDIKQMVKIEKIPGGSIEDSKVLDGILINKDVVHANMRRRIENPRILLLDCNLEYKKGESTTAMEISGEQDMYKALKLEEDYIARICQQIIDAKPDLVITEKGVSDLAQHFLVEANITVLRRLRKSENLRVAAACGATILNETEGIREEDIGKRAGLFEVRTIGEEYFSFITQCGEASNACSVVLRGPSKDILKEIERNLQDAMAVARNVLQEHKLVPGGGAFEMAISKHLRDKAAAVLSSPSSSGVVSNVKESAAARIAKQKPYLVVAESLEVVARTLVENCGGKVLHVMTELRNKHKLDGDAPGWSFGIDGNAGCVADMKRLGVWDPLSVKEQVLKTSVETAIGLLRIDDIVSGTKKQKGDGSGKPEEN